MIPHKTPFFLPWLYPSLTWRMECPARELYLTFDDGPVPGPTEFVLQELARAAIPATFFCIGDNIVKYPEIFRRIRHDGHSIGNHTMNHLNGWKASTENYLDNVKKFDSAAAEAGGSNSQTDLFRPPYGRITRRQIKALAGYRIIMWDVLTQDYRKRLTSERCLRLTIQACRPGSIVVFHDSYKSEKNMHYILPRLIDHFAGQGYTFGRI